MGVLGLAGVELIFTEAERQHSQDSWPKVAKGIFHAM